MLMSIFLLLVIHYYIVIRYMVIRSGGNCQIIPLFSLFARLAQ